MQYRQLGKTDLTVSEIGLGTEYLHHQPTAKVVSVIRTAIEHGINYVDLVFAFPEYRDNMATALRGYRDHVILTGHICCAYNAKGHYRLSRDAKENEELFYDLLKRLKTDYVDILMIQMINEVESYQNVMQPDGVFELVQRLKHAGKARYIGISGHKIPAAMPFLEQTLVDVFMFPINLAWDLIPGRRAVFEICAKNRIGLVAMKIYGGGRIFQRKDRTITSTQCVSYALSQPGVCTVIPGVKTLKHLQDALTYLTASEQEKAYRSLLTDFQEELQGNCVYCNHCLPCPVGIDIGKTLQYLDRKIAGMSASQKDQFKQAQEKVGFYYPARIRPMATKGKLSKKASKCNECGVCMKRCPFEVDVIDKMRQAKSFSK